MYRFHFLLICMMVLFTFSSKFTLSQNLPTDNQTLADAKKAIKTATVVKAEFTGDWKMEKESGYTFANLAKRPVKMQVKDNTTGKERRFEGLAIYERGAPSDKWMFSRYFTFTNSIEIIGQQADTGLLKSLTLEAMRNNPAEWLGDISGIYWVYPITLVPGSFRQSSEKEMSWQVTVQMDRRWDNIYLVHREKTIGVTAYLKMDGKTWTLDPGNDGEREISRKEMKTSQLDKMPTIGSKGFDKLYGQGSANPQ